MKPAKDYWEERFTELENAQNKYAKKVFHKDIEPFFDKAQRDMQAEIEKWYGRYAKNNNISIAEAKKQLTGRELKELRWDINEYIKYGQENAVNQKWMKELENASAKFHVTRLEALKLRTQQAAEVAFGNEVDAIDEMMGKIYEDGYYKTCFEIQKGTGIGFEVGQIDERQVKKVISKPWASDGKVFSDRVWTAKKEMVNGLHQELSNTIIQGKAPDEAIKKMTKYLQDKTDNAKYKAGRLVMTEQAFIASAAQQDAFNELEVEEYEVVATLDSHTSKICQEKDGKHFPMKNYKIGSTAPPFHVFCRSTTVPYFDDEFEIEQRAARGNDGKTYYVPSDMTYPQWKNSFVGESSSNNRKSVANSGKSSIIKVEKLDKLKNSGMEEADYEEYLQIINNQANPDILRLYQNYADKISGVTKTDIGRYIPDENRLLFDYQEKYPDLHKYSTLAHEYGHFFDKKADFSGLNFTEIEAVGSATGLDEIFAKVASSSDEFLAAVRKDKEHLKSVLTDEVKEDFIEHNTSNGIQDAIDGLFSGSRISWGHGENYYNRKYAAVAKLDKLLGSNKKKKNLQEVYKNIGLDASSQAKVKIICRQYEASSEMWANIMSAIVCGDESLEYAKTYLPNSYKAIIEILKGVK